MALTQVQVPYEKSLDFGIGVDSNTTSPMNKAVQGKISSVIGAEAAKVGFEITRIQSTHELETKLKIDVDASYGAASFGAGVADRFNFATSTKIETSSLFLAITAEVQLTTDSIDEPSLTPNASAIVDNPQTFAIRFGDMFVRGISRGGLFVAVLKIETSSEETSKTISNKLSGSYGAFSAKAETNFTDAIQDQKVDISIKVYHEGGPVDLIMDNLRDPAQIFGLLKTWLQSFAADPGKNAVPYSAILAPMAIANGPLPLNAADSEHAQDVLVRCARQRSAAMDSMNLMDAIMQSPQRYAFVPAVSMADIAAASAGYQADLDIVASAASAAMNHPASAKMPAEFAVALGQQFPKGIQPTPMPVLKSGPLSVLADRGQLLAASDALLASLRELEPAGFTRLGFDIGLAIDEDGTAPGPGKEKFKNDHVDSFDSAAYQRAVDYTMDRNANAFLAARGIAVMLANPAAAEARAKLPLSNRWLGFDIAAGHFAPINEGGEGSTAQGTGSVKIRLLLSASAKVGWDAAIAFFGIPSI